MPTVHEPMAFDGWGKREHTNTHTFVCPYMTQSCFLSINFRHGASHSKMYVIVCVEEAVTGAALATDVGGCAI